MGRDIKHIDIKEFRELGFVQEINRRFLHPCGLALEVTRDTETGEEHISGVWDFRDDPEGLYFEVGELEAEKTQTVQRLLNEKAAARLEALGFVVQPGEVS